MGPGTRRPGSTTAACSPTANVTFFDDGSNPPIHRQSRGRADRARLRTHKVARLVFAYTHADPPLLAASQGNMQTLPNGNALVGYGGVPAISEYAPDGIAPLRRPHALRHDLLPRLPLPLERTPVDARRRWSRASTTPAKRRSCTRAGTVPPGWPPGGCSPGPSPGSLTARSDDSRRELRELARPCPTQYAYVAVQALDAAGRVLAQLASAEPVGSYAASLLRGYAASRAERPRSVGGLGFRRRFLAVVVVRRRGRRARRAARRGGAAFPAAAREHEGDRQTRPGALAWRSVAICASAGLPSSLEGSGAHPTRRPSAPPTARARNERRDRGNPGDARGAPGQRRAGAPLAVAAGRLLRGPVHGHPRPEHRQRGAAAHPVEPRLLLVRTCSGSSTPTRSPSPAS